MRLDEFLPLKKKMKSLILGCESHESLVESLSLIERLKSFRSEKRKKQTAPRSKKVMEVMKDIDRGLFVPEGVQAYVDSPMFIGYNATISAPHMHAACLELLSENLQPGMCPLDVGSEHIPELASTSIENIQKSAAAPLLEGGSLSINDGDGRLGWPEFAPYDAIHVGAAAPEIPQPLIDQLKPGGRLVIPVGVGIQDLQVVDKKLDGSVTVHNEFSVRYIPLTSRDVQLKG